MAVELVKWSPVLKLELIDVCNSVDRSFLSNRLPFPYTESSADWWLGMVSEHDGKDGVFRAVVVDGKVVGNISVEQKADVYCRDGEIGYLLLTEYWSKGIMTEAECPNETLRRVFSRYVGTDGKGIHFDAWNASDFVYTVEFD